MKRDLIKTLTKTISNNSPAIVKAAVKKCGKYSAEIFTGMSIAGVGVTAFFAAKNTLKAAEIIKEAEEEAEEPLTVKDKVRLTWKVYIPTASSAILTGVCVVGINASHKRRYASVVAACTTLEKALSEYGEAVVETVDEKTFEKIKEKRDEHILENNPVDYSKVIKTGYGDDLCFDAWSGRYFYSNANFLEKVYNEKFKGSLEAGHEDFLPLNDWYYEIGLDSTRAGEVLGFDVQDIADIRITTRLTPDNKPCVVVDFIDLTF